MMPRVTLDRLPEWVAADPALVRRGRFLIEVGEVAWLVTVHEGRVTRVERGPFLMREWTFAIRASADAWRRYWEAVPAPGFHDLFALTKGGHARVACKDAPGPDQPLPQLLLPVVRVGLGERDLT